MLLMVYIQRGLPLEGWQWRGTSDQLPAWLAGRTLHSAGDGLLTLPGRSGTTQALPGDWLLQPPRRHPADGVVCCVRRALHRAGNRYPASESGPDGASSPGGAGGFLRAAEDFTAAIGVRASVGCCGAAVRRQALAGCPLGSRRGGVSAAPSTSTQSCVRNSTACSGDKAPVR